MPLVTIGSHVFFGATENFKNPAKSEKTLGAGTSGMQCWKATPASQCRASRCLRATKNQARWVPFFQSVVFLQKSAWNMLKPQTTGAIFGGQPCHQGWQIRSSLIQELFTVVFSPWKTMPWKGFSMDGYGEGKPHGSGMFSQQRSGHIQTNPTSLRSLPSGYV